MPRKKKDKFDEAISTLKKEAMKKAYKPESMKKDDLEEDSKQFYSMYFSMEKQIPVIIKRGDKVILEVKPDGDILIKGKVVENDIDIYQALNQMITELQTYLKENK